MIRRHALLLATLFGFALCGCATLGESQRALLLSGEQAFRNRRYEQSIAQTTQFLKSVQQGPESGRAYYVRGMAAALLGRRPQAYADLRAAIREFGDPRESWRPQVALGVLCFEDEDWHAAYQLFWSAVERMPPGSPKDAVLYRAGLCQERLGRWNAALDTFARVAREFPAGPYADNARRRLHLRADYFAVQCGAFSRLEYAQQLANQLRQRGLQPYICAEQRKGTTYQVVREGRYATYAEAMQALARVRGYVPEAVLWP